MFWRNNKEIGTIRARTFDNRYEIRELSYFITASIVFFCRISQQENFYANGDR